jgi:hypothetical protein
MQVSSNFGNVFSMTGVSSIIPFLPMLPKQVLTQNLMSDVAVMSIPTERLLAKIHIVILSEAKNIMFFFSNQKIKRGDPSDLRPQDVLC